VTLPLLKHFLIELFSQKQSVFAHMGIVTVQTFLWLIMFRDFDQVLARVAFQADHFPFSDQNAGIFALMGIVTHVPIPFRQGGM